MERERAEDVAEAHGGPLRAVAGGHGHVAHARVEDIEVDEHVILEEVPAGEATQVEEPESARGDGDIAVLRIEDVPVAGGELGEKRQHEVPREAGLGHDVELAA